METMKVSPGAGGFWELGQFSKADSKMFNPWANDGEQMAPFDREVSNDYCLVLHQVYQRTYPLLELLSNKD